MTRALEVVTTENAGSNLQTTRELIEGLHTVRHLAPKDHQHHLRATQIGVATSVQCHVQCTSDPVTTVVSYKNL